MNSQGDDSELCCRGDFAGVGYAVAVAVLPDADAIGFAAGQLAIGVIVEGGEGFEAVFPEHPPGD
jgi:hypothetical protein